MHTPHLHFQETLKGCSLLDELVQGRCGVHLLGTSHQNRCLGICRKLSRSHTEQACKKVERTRRNGRTACSGHRGTRKTKMTAGQERKLVEKLTHVLQVHQNRPKHAFTIGGLQASERSPFLPALILNVSTFSVST